MSETLILLAAIFPLLFVVSIPVFRALLKGEIPDIFEPPWMVAGTLLIGTTIRTLFLQFDPNVDQNMSQILGPFMPEKVLPMGLLAVNMGVFFWWLGYHLPIPSEIFAKKYVPRVFITRKWSWTMLAIIFVSLILMLLYLRQIGFSSLLSTYGISAKRMFEVDNQVGNTTTFTYFRMASDFLATVAIVYFAWLMAIRKFKLNRLFTFLILFFLACLIPFVASARGEIIYLFFSILIVYHYMIKRVPLRNVVFFMGIAFILLGFMGILRTDAYKRIRGGEVAQAVSTTSATIHTLAYNAHFFGVGKTSVVVAQVPQKTDYLKGQSYLSLLYAPIPRTIWKNKPVVRIGRFVGLELYERPSITGVPPGMVGEAYLNFGWGGIIFIPLFVGLFCKFLYQRLIVFREPDDFFAVALYGILWIFMMDVIVTDFTGNIMRIMRYLIPFYILYKMSVFRDDGYQSIGV